MAITVAIESPLHDEVRQLIGELNQALLALTPAEFCYHMTAEEMARPDTTVFVARDGGTAVACGALRRHDASTGEVKRMYTRPAHQGRGIGGLILDAIEATVRRIARLARIKVTDEEARALEKELSGILDWVKQLDEVDVGNVEPMTRVIPMTLKKREYKVTDGEIAEQVLANAPQREENFFVVPKVVE